MSDSGPETDTWGQACDLCDLCDFGFGGVMWPHHQTTPCGDEWESHKSAGLSLGLSLNRLLNQLGSKYTAETFGDLFDRVGTDRIKIDHKEFERLGEPTASA